LAKAVAFLDTVGLLALVNRDDSLYGRARQVNRKLALEGYELVTSDWVLAELLGGAAHAPLRGPACQTIRRLQESRRTTIVPATREDWVRAFELFASRPDKEWSLVDCSSILICRERNIREVFTHDHHFEQAGLTVLL
jgi:predicted nucleic acid-binding protein